MFGACVLALTLLVVASVSAEDEQQKRPTFLDKARQCEEQCEGRRGALPECDLFCIDEACFERVFGKLGVFLAADSADESGDVAKVATEAELDDPQKLESFTRCAKLRLLPAVPSAMRSKAALRDEQRRQMAAWRERLAEHSRERSLEKAAQFEAQKQARAQLEADKAAKREVAKRTAAAATAESKTEL
eukprot:TRINITY_DN921_c0_g1_i1.p2 TRINITY_DN921_c0_g1~~TRINITY_DN921_c0_g1_i1.p2  ORF type:complete len:203 (+),score=68.65 TRINITY_DN921_c0_g1_i1:45-611(+)